MNILLANKFFFLNGGVEKYYRELSTRLLEMGHAPIPFSVAYAGSWESPYGDFFLPSPDKQGKAHFKDIRIRPDNICSFLGRSMYSFEARRYLERLLRAIGRVEFAYLFNIYNYMSPSIIDTLKRRGIPVLLQVGDYNLFCPCYTFLRDNVPCTLCLEGAYHHGLLHCCVKRRFLPSLVRVAAMYIQKWLRIYQRVDAFIVPCRFMKEKMVAGGFPEDRVHLLPYPMPLVRERVSVPKKNYILYFGRLSPEKGVDTLLTAYQQLAAEVDLHVIGRSYDGELERLRRIVQPAFQGKIHFHEFMEKEHLHRWVAEALISVVPSRWYDNAPLSIYESFQRHTPVVGAAIGGIPEQIQDGITGKLFPPENVPGLTAALQWMLADRDRLADMGTAGAAFVAEQCDMDAHIRQLFGIVKRLGPNSR